jgi:hypothetical protein
MAVSEEMAMVETAKIAIQLGARSLSAEGSEAFVREAIALWDRLEAAPAVLPAGATYEFSSGDTTPAGRAARSKAGPSEYENVFDEVDGRLKLIAHIPGNSKADKTRNVALAVLFGHYLRGEEQVPSEIIRDTCADQGCFDQANFAQSLKGLKEKVAMNTKSGGGYDVKLTAPGRKAAKELVETLNQDSA